MMTEVHTVSIVAKNRYSAKQVASPTSTKNRNPLRLSRQGGGLIQLPLSLQP
jgi:hypothetical protein